MSNRAYLDRLHTRELLDYLKQSRKYNGSYSANGVHYHSTEEIKAVLATREHIPNKVERKQARQEQARAKKHRPGNKPA